MEMKEIDNLVKCYCTPSVKIINISTTYLYAASPVPGDPGTAGDYDSDDDIYGPEF